MSFWVGRFDSTAFSLVPITHLRSACRTAPLVQVVSVDQGPAGSVALKAVKLFVCFHPLHQKVVASFTLGFPSTSPKNRK